MHKGVFTQNEIKCFVRKVTWTIKQFEVMTLSNVTLRCMLENNCEVLCETTDRKQNCLVSNSAKDIFINCLRQKSTESSYDNKSD